MTWEEGKFSISSGKPDINQELLKIEGHLDEQDAKYHLHNFLRENITFTTNLISGVELFPFQHLAIKSMLETDYFLGIWSRGMSKSFSTAIYAFLDAIFNQGVQIGILAATFRQSKMIFEKIEDIARSPSAQFLSCLLYTSPSPRDRG